MVKKNYMQINMFFRFVFIVDFSYFKFLICVFVVLARLLIVRCILLL